MAFDVMIEDEGMRGTQEFLHVASESPYNVLVLGESGVGKEVFARSIHERCEQTKSQPFVAINCGAIPKEMIESELFGHTKGAFTGASKDQPGKLEYVGEGTLFLDEIGDMPLDMQVKLLRAVQERQGSRIGSHKLIEYEFRLICATHRNLQNAIASGSFREDLYYRISVLETTIPPLRARKKDIAALARFFWNSFCSEHRKSPVLTREVVDVLCAYKWPGNIRQLENEMKRLFAFTPENQPTQIEHLSAALQTESVEAYDPKPIDVSRTSIPNNLQALVEVLAENTHDIWAQKRISEGWRYGAKRDDDARTHPDLLPYDQLSDGEKDYDRIVTSNLIKAILKSGYNIDGSESGFGTLSFGNLKQQTTLLEQQLIAEALKATKGNKSESSRLLGKSRKWLIDRLKSPQ